MQIEIDLLSKIPIYVQIIDQIKHMHIPMKTTSDSGKNRPARTITKRSDELYTKWTIYSARRAFFSVNRPPKQCDGNCG